MLKPLELKIQHTYKYLELNEEGLRELYRLRLVRTSCRSEESFVQWCLLNSSTPIVIDLGGHQYGVFFSNFLVFQYSPDGAIDGLVAFDTKSKMLEFFNEIEG